MSGSEEIAIHVEIQNEVIGKSLRKKSDSINKIRLGASLDILHVSFPESPYFARELDSEMQGAQLNEDVVRVFAQAVCHEILNKIERVSDSSIRVFLKLILLGTSRLHPIASTSNSPSWGSAYHPPKCYSSQATISNPNWIVTDAHSHGILPFELMKGQSSFGMCDFET